MIRVAHIKLYESKRPLKYYFNHGETDLQIKNFLKDLGECELLKIETYKLTETKTTLEDENSAS